MATLNLDECPPEFVLSHKAAKKALEDLQKSSGKHLSEESSILNLLSSGFTSQAETLEKVVKTLQKCTLQPGQEIEADLAEQWKKHVDITRKLQRVAAQTLNTEQGILESDSTIDLINKIPEAEGEQENVPESSIKALKMFSGEDLADQDLETEQFIQNCYEVGASQKLTHKALKN